MDEIIKKLIRVLLLLIAIIGAGYFIVYMVMGFAIVMSGFFLAAIVSGVVWLLLHIFYRDDSNTPKKETEIKAQRFTESTFQNESSDIFTRRNMAIVLFVVFVIFIIFCFITDSQHKNTINSESTTATYSAPTPSGQAISQQPQQTQQPDAKNTVQELTPDVIKQKAEKGYQKLISKGISPDRAKEAMEKYYNGEMQAYKTRQQPVAKIINNETSAYDASSVPATIGQPISKASNQWHSITCSEGGFYVEAPCIMQSQVESQYDQNGYAIKTITYTCDQKTNTYRASVLLLPDGYFNNANYAALYKAAIDNVSKTSGRVSSINDCYCGSIRGRSGVQTKLSLLKRRAMPYASR